LGYTSYNNSSNGYVLEKRLGYTLGNHNWGSWSVIPISGSVNNYEDIAITINTSGPTPEMVEYRLRANDNVYYSDYTSSLDISYGNVFEKTKGIKTNTSFTNYNLL